jgi:type II secretory pathway pseudopilin PulG
MLPRAGKDSPDLSTRGRDSDEPIRLRYVNYFSGNNTKQTNLVGGVDVSTTTLIVIIVVVVIVVLLLALYFASRRRAAQRSEEQRERSREEFGSEYERTAQERGSEEEAERELRERRGRVERQVEPLSEESRGRYEEQWGEVERVFVDNPERSIEMADRTVSDILNERNFDSDAGQSDEETERSLGAMHPDVADDYREARRIRAVVVARSAGRADEGLEEESTEDLRQAIRKYRAVYQRIVRD